LHRDLKPKNILLDSLFNIKIADLGLAKAFNQKISENQNDSKFCVGTPYYMPPEIWFEGNWTEKSDIWSLGVIIYELCSLKKPFEAANQN
jgi:NIMA (never in mitosis gene a)-related kinase